MVTVCNGFTGGQVEILEILGIIGTTA